MSVVQPTVVAQSRPPGPIVLGRATSHRDTESQEGLLIFFCINNFVKNFMCGYPN